MIMQFDNYKSYLNEVLAGKQSNNARYSLRSLAQYLGLAPSMLSDVLKDRRNLSLTKGAQIASRLKLSEKESEYFLLLISREKAKNEELQSVLEDRINILNPKRKVKDIGLDVFRLINDWYHLAVLQLAGLESFEFKENSIALILGISNIQARQSIELLEKLELLEFNGIKYTKTDLNILASSTVPNNGLRNYHRQTLSKAIDSIENQSPKEKFIGSETFAFNEEALCKFNELAEEFFEKVIALSDNTESKNEVYHLAVQCFKLTKDNIGNARNL